MYGKTRGPRSIRGFKRDRDRLTQLQVIVALRNSSPAAGATLHYSMTAALEEIRRLVSVRL